MTVVLNLVSAIIKKHYAVILSHVNLEQLLVQLKVYDLVTQEEEYMLLNANFSLQKSTKLLLLCLHSKDPINSILLFYQCLRVQKEHSGHQYLADLLEPDIREFESQSQVPDSKGASNSNAAGMTKSEIDNILPTLTFYWMQVAEMINNIAAPSQDPEEQAIECFFNTTHFMLGRKTSVMHWIS